MDAERQQMQQCIAWRSPECCRTSGTHQRMQATGGNARRAHSTTGQAAEAASHCKFGVIVADCVLHACAAPAGRNTSRSQRQ